MFRATVLFLCLQFVLGSVPQCTRPIINHWLDSNSLRNESFTIFGDHPAHKKEIFFTLKHSECQSHSGGKTRLFCNGYAFSLDCQKGDSTFKPHEILIGLGQHSLMWNHYKRMILTEGSITFGDRDLAFDETDGIKLQCENTEFEEHPALCGHVNGEVIYGAKNELTTDVNIMLFSDSVSTVVPPDLYASIISGNNEFHYKSKLDSDVVRCGENCIWTSDIWTESGNAVSRGVQDFLVLGTLARQQLKISYDATDHYLHIVPSAHRSKYLKISSQIILIIKLGVLCFLGTTASVQKYDRNLSNFISTISVFIGLEIFLFSHSAVFLISGLGQVALLLALNMLYDNDFEMGGQLQAAILALVLIQSTLIELSFFELSILALMAHGVIAMSTFMRLLLYDARQLALLFSGFVLISIILTFDVLQSDLEEFKCLFGLSSSPLLYIFFSQISLALSLEWILRKKS